MKQIVYECGVSVNNRQKQTRYFDSMNFKLYYKVMELRTYVPQQRRGITVQRTQVGAPKIQVSHIITLVFVNIVINV